MKTTLHCGHECKEAYFFPGRGWRCQICDEVESANHGAIALQVDNAEWPSIPEQEPLPEMLSFRVRGAVYDPISDCEVLANSQHFQFWTKRTTHDESGKPFFNLDFLGKERIGPLDTLAAICRQQRGRCFCGCHVSYAI